MKVRVIPPEEPARRIVIELSEREASRLAGLLYVAESVGPNVNDVSTEPPTSLCRALGRLGVVPDKPTVTQRERRQAIRILDEVTE